MTRRMERVAEEIREEVARILGGEVKDPRLGFVTVTRVEATPDLKLARVHVSVLGDDAQRRRSLSAMRQASGFIRRRLSNRIRLRHSPELRFEYDAGVDAAARVAELLEKAREESSEQDDES
ncbi:MAG: 30S ribosome-binding factor RbfA [Vicinamibacteria bacterium]|nr:30S ribosome-binding factor RbfA [Vicinamibacteria bacterium]